MKVYLNIAIVALVAMFSASCAYNNQSATINGGGGGGGTRTVRHDSPKVKSASSVFGNQPVNPTSDAVQSTWGATMGSEYWWNDARKGDRALLQKTSPGEPVLVARQSGFVWRAGCYNRVTPAEPYTEEVVVEKSSGGGNSIVQNGPSYALAINLPITIVGDSGGYQSRGYSYQREYYQPRYRPQRYRPQREYCPPGYYRPTPQPRPRPQQEDCPPGYYRPRGR